MPSSSALAITLTASSILASSAAQADEVRPGQSASQTVGDSAHLAGSAVLKRGRKTSDAVKNGGADTVKTRTRMSVSGTRVLTVN